MAKSHHGDQRRGQTGTDQAQFSLEVHCNRHKSAGGASSAELILYKEVVQFMIEQMGKAHGKWDLRLDSTMLANARNARQGVHAQVTGMPRTGPGVKVFINPSPGMSPRQGTLMLPGWITADQVIAAAIKAFGANRTCMYIASHKTGKPVEQQAEGAKVLEFIPQDEITSIVPLPSTPPPAPQGADGNGFGTEEELTVFTVDLDNDDDSADSLPKPTSSNLQSHRQAQEQLQPQTKTEPDKEKEIIDPALLQTIADLLQDMIANADGQILSSQLDQLFDSMADDIRKICNNYGLWVDHNIAYAVTIEGKKFSISGELPEKPASRKPTSKPGKTSPSAKRAKPQWHERGAFYRRSGWEFDKKAAEAAQMPQLSGQAPQIDDEFVINFDAGPETESALGHSPARNFAPPEETREEILARIQTELSGLNTELEAAEDKYREVADLQVSIREATHLRDKLEETRETMRASIADMRSKLEQMETKLEADRLQILAQEQKIREANERLKGEEIREITDSVMDLRRKVQDCRNRKARYS